MKNSLKIFFIRGIPIELHWTFLLLISWVLLMQLIAREHASIVLLTISEMLAVFVCVLLHELGHTFAALHYNIPIKKIQLLPFGGITFFSGQPGNPRQEIIVSMAGPLVNITIATLLIPFLPAGTPFWKLGTIITSIHSANFSHFLYNINITLAIINLLPALPLDGGKMLKGLLGLRFTPYTALKTSLFISRAISLLLTIAGLLTGNLLFILYGCFLLLMSGMEKDNYLISFLMKDENVGDVISRDFKTLNVRATPEEILHTLGMGNDRYYVLTDNGNIIGILDKETILYRLLTNRNEITLQDLVIPDLSAVRADSKLIEIWNRLPDKADLILPVTTSTNKLIGVVSRDNILSSVLKHATEKHKKPYALAWTFPLLLSLFSVQQKGHSDTTGYHQHAMRLLHDTPTLAWKYNPTAPLPGAILPYKRIVAFYGNLYSPKMGILGELPPDKMKAQLLAEAGKWELADPLFRVQPALHYIAITAQRNPGRDKKYRLRMPGQQIDSIIKMAREINAIIILDVQVGHSTLQEELTTLEKYLQLPDVHLGIDPEYSMKNNAVPSSEIGTFDAADINFACDYLKTLVLKYHLPPKILVVHRFTQGMITNYREIHPCEQVQIVINMDGFGFPAKKRDSYKYFIAKEPVQYTGFKLFYKNDITPIRQTIMQPEEILRLYPIPVYIQYQ
ncbi:MULTISPECIES: site-2 protease family protein [unclassified Chitinophaga]|uniref:site-2 protease family protein n=1 Tax=unclassified Chitinophaga TaxID=2619133 RepID=UPI0015C2CBE3|nr:MULTISPECIES: site-2 protease family protein [unclassified Chitinophaga]WPV64621.1 site-2 protease family protein [Chitinophaga sp. LS1]